MSDFDTCLAFTLEAEGGYQCLADDAGNWTGGHCGVGELVGTCYGISAPVFAAWLGRGLPLTAAMMQALPRAEAASIYGAQYWLPCGAPHLAPGVDLMVFDHAVNCGVRASVLLLQAAVGVTADGYAGPHTVAASHCAAAANLIDCLARLQGTAYRTLPGSGDFLAGWLARLERRQAAAHRLLAGQAA